MKRRLAGVVVVHPQVAADAVVLVTGGVLYLGSWLLMRWARAGDDALADFAFDDLED